jgi:hypothetical protein
MARLCIAINARNGGSIFDILRNRQSIGLAIQAAPQATTILNVAIRNFHLHYFTLGPSTNGHKVVTHWTLGGLAKLILPKYTRKDITLLVRFSKILLFTLLKLVVSVGGPSLQVR